MTGAKQGFATDWRAVSTTDCRWYSLEAVTPAGYRWERQLAVAPGVAAGRSEPLRPSAGVLSGLAEGRPGAGFRDTRQRGSGLRGSGHTQEPAGSH